MSFPAGAAGRVVDAAAVDQAALSLTPFVSLLEDPDRSLTLADVQAPERAARFQGDLPPGNALALGFTRSAYWLRLVLRNPGDTRCGACWWWRTRASPMSRRISRMRRASTR